MPRNQTPRQFLEWLNGRPESLASRGGENSPASPKDIFRARLQQTSDENQERQERQQEIIRQKMAAIRAIAHPVNDPVKEPETREATNESEEA